MVSALSAGAESQQAAHGVMQSLQVADGAAAPGGFHPAGISLFHPQQAATSQMQKAKKTKWFYKAHPLSFQKGLYKQAQQIYVLEDVSIREPQVCFLKK